MRARPSAVRGPVLRPPWLRQRPFGSGGEQQILPERVRAPHWLPWLVRSAVSAPSRDGGGSSLKVMGGLPVPGPCRPPPQVRLMAAASRRSRLATSGFSPGFPLTGRPRCRYAVATRFEGPQHRDGGKGLGIRCWSPGQTPGGCRHAQVRGPQPRAREGFAADPLRTSLRTPTSAASTIAQV
jgi:hypothetical protein